MTSHLTEIGAAVLRGPIYIATQACVAVALFASAQAVAAPASASAGKVLIVLSSASELELKDGKKYRTGFYLDELAIPLRKIVDAGYVPVFADPEGNKVSFDPVSNDKVFFGNDDGARAEAVRFIDGFAGIAKPQTLAAVLKEGTADYVGIFIPGGHAPMQDLMQEKALGEILRDFHTSSRPTGVICHSPTALLSAMSDPVAYRKAMADGDYFGASKIARDWPYADYRLTVFATNEEKAVEGPRGQLGGYLQFYAADALAQASAHVDQGPAFHPNIVEDREVVSGQQPFSSELFGDAFVAKLNASVPR